MLNILCIITKIILSICHFEKFAIKKNLLQIIYNIEYILEIPVIVLKIIAVINKIIIKVVKFIVSWSSSKNYKNFKEKND